MKIKSSELYLTIALFAICCLMDTGLTIYRIIGLALFGIAVLHVLFQKQIVVTAPIVNFWSWFIILWVFITVHTFLFTDWSWGWRGIIIYLLPAVAVVVYFSTGFTKMEIKEDFYNATIYAAILSILYVTVKELPAIMAGGSRIGDSASGNVNALAINLCSFFAVLSFEAIYLERKRLFPLLVILSLFILLTGSKKGVVGIFIIIVILFAGKYRLKVWKYILPIIILLLVYELIMNNSYFYAIIGRRVDAFFSALETKQSNNSTGERLSMYQLGWNYFRSSPWLGNGYGYFAKYSLFSTYSHSNYIELLVSFGLLGFLLYYSQYIRIIIKVIKNIKKNMITILCITIIALQLFFDTASIGYYNDARFYIFIFFMLIFLEDEYMY